MPRPPFLDRPGLWTRTGSTASDPVREACAIERPAPSLAARVADALCWGVALVLLAILAAAAFAV